MSSVSDLVEALLEDGIVIDIRSADAPIKLSFEDINGVAYTLTRPFKHSEDPHDEFRREGVFLLVKALQEEIMYRAGIEN